MDTVLADRNMRPCTLTRDDASCCMLFRDVSVLVVSVKNQ